MKKLEELGISPAPWSTKTSSIVCWVEDKDGDALTEDFTDHAHAVENARLIAAAPMMYKALWDIVEFIDGHSTGDDDLAYFVAPIAEEALAKASGEEVAK